MAKDLKIELSADQVTTLMAALPPEARQPGSGITYADGALTVPAAFAAAASAVMKRPGWDAPPDPKLALLGYAADRRWRSENAGTTFEGRPMRTDRDTRGALIEAHVATTLDPEFETPWQLSDGTTLVVSAANISSIISAVAAHRAAAFSRFETVKADIKAGKIKSTAEIDIAFEVR